MKIAATPVWPGAVQAQPMALRFRAGNEDKPDEFVSSAEEADEEECDCEKEKPGPVYDALMRLSAAMLIAATALLVYTRYQQNKPDFDVPPRIHTQQAPVEPKAP